MTLRSYNKIHSNGFKTIESRASTTELILLSKQVMVVHACTDTSFHGNPTGVLWCYSPPDSAVMSALAQHMSLPVIVTLEESLPVLVTLDENNTSKTFLIRWFTKTAELDLCGYGLMAASYMLFDRRGGLNNQLWFRSRCGMLLASRESGQIVLDLPQFDSSSVDDVTASLVENVLNLDLLEVRRSTDDLIAVARSENYVTGFVPDFTEIEKLECRGIILTAQTSSKSLNTGYDFVLRFFAPRIAIFESQVCISAHCKLYSYWTAICQSQVLYAWQASTNGGRMKIEGQNGRVLITGRACKTIPGK
ncbi:PhzF family phenazine biosynthesis protein [Halomonas sp. SpR8]|uniref:PhzF family phenazine biosynthesis protein n=1 Tax=Halomonas sp. SpR8 TaxID=3050463 RepID=UPI0027E57CC1|nr:PhzF family phenazine biosynthesis protein [Halomonas sp. SpR8]MDQ7730603.1 PhzF family phenazine biosynthesis protein [Halomonas sp. SpR8]